MVLESSWSLAKFMGDSLFRNSVRWRWERACGRYAVRRFKYDPAPVFSPQVGSHCLTCNRYTVLSVLF